MKSSLLLQGETGSGKTYKAITSSKSFVIAVPCRQLAYELFIDYKQITSLSTGEVYIKNTNSSNTVYIYESLPNEPIHQDTLIIDEAHYLNDKDRGYDLLQKILINKKAGKKIILLTATNILSNEVKELLNIKEITLKPFIETTKEEVSMNVIIKKIREGMKTIVFVKYTPSLYNIEKYAELFEIDKNKIKIISANTTTLQRVKTQIDFKAGKIQVVLSTNVLAQGVNFPAEGVIIEYNEWDSWEIIEQKIGRIARPFLCKKGYFCLDYIPPKSKATGLPQKNNFPVDYYYRGNNKINIKKWGVQQFQLPRSNKYKDFKYSLSFLKQLQKEKGISNIEEEILCYLENQNKMTKNYLLKKKIK